jgi:hypothetical protein
MAEVDGRFPAGKYYFGDICYVLADNHYYQVWGDKYNFDPGIIPIGGPSLLSIPPRMEMGSTTVWTIRVCNTSCPSMLGFWVSYLGIW